MTKNGHFRARTLVYLLVLLLLSASVGAGVASAAVATDAPPAVWTDKGDYAPGELVVLSGDHWQPGEVVHLRVNDDHGSSWSRDVDVTAAEDGTITDTFNLPGWFVAQYTVTATGSSGSTATWTFTDGNLKVTLRPSPFAAQITAKTYANATCSDTATGDKSGAAGDGVQLTIGIGSSESVRLDAPATATSGAASRAFAGWTAETGLQVSPVANTGGRSVCVVGFQSGNTDIFVDYAATGNTAPSLTAAANQSATEGAAKAIALGSFADPDADSPWKVEVNWGDGTTESFTAATAGSLGTRDHTYADNGTYTATVKVTERDGAGVQDSKSFQIAVANAAPVVTAPAGQSADEGTAASFDLGSFADPGADTWTVDVDWGDGATVSFTASAAGTLPAKPHTYADNGTYTVKVTVSDDDAGAETKTFTATVGNLAPTASLGNDGPITEGGSATVTFTDQADASPVDAAAGLRYAFHCDGAAFDAAPTYAAAATTSCSFADDGVHTVRARIVDKDGGWREYTTDVTVRNAAPVVTAAADQQADEGSAKAFDLGSFTDAGADDAPWSVDVDWGDATPHTTFDADGRGSLGSRSHTYADNGTYTVTVEVTDKDGASHTATFAVTVANVAPTVSKPSDDSADEGTSRDFGLGSFTDPGAGDGPWSVDVDWGDGSAPLHTTRAAAGPLGLAPHAYRDNGTYSVAVTVTDKDGAADTQTYSVAVRNVAPTAELGNDGPITEGGSATVSFSGATDASPDDVAAGFTYAIRCDGGTPDAADAGPAASRSCSFADDGTKTVTGIVVDKDGGARAYSTAVVVENAAPVVTAAADQSGREGTAKAFDLGSFTDAGVDDGPWRVDVTWGDGSAATQAQSASAGALAAATHIYADNGVYTVSVGVTDKDGAKSTKTLTVTVDNVAPTITEFSGTDYLAGSNAFLSGSTPRSAFTTRFTDPGADTWTGQFTYSDGAPLTETVGAFRTGDVRTHAFAGGGCKTASVKVTDDDGGSATASTPVKVSTGAFQPPMTNQPVTDKLRNGQVLPVKVRITDCAGAGVATLAPVIRLVTGDQTPQNDDSAVAITPTSVSAADTSGVMRSQGGGDYIYNMRVDLPKLSTDYTVVVYPYGTGSPAQLGKVIQATK